MVTSSKLLACWLTVGPGSGGVGFVWGVCDCEVGVVHEAHQGGEEGVGCGGRVILFDCEGQGECHEEVQEGGFRFSLQDPATWLQEGGEACSGADCVLAGADVAGGEVVEGAAHAFPHCVQKEPGGVGEGSLDVEGGNDEVYGVHVRDGVLEEDGLVWGPVQDGPPEAGGYVGVEVGADAAQEDGPDDFDLRDCTDYGAAVVWVGPVPLFVDGADNVCPVWWQGGLPRDNVPEAVGEDAEEVGGAVVVYLRKEAVVAWGFVLPETVDGPPDFVDAEGALFLVASSGRG